MASRLGNQVFAASFCLLLFTHTVFANANELVQEVIEPSGDLSDLSSEAIGEETGGTVIRARRGAIKGAILGAIAGAIGGHYWSKHQKAKDEKKRVQAENGGHEKELTNQRQRDNERIRAEKRGRDENRDDTGVN